MFEDEAGGKQVVEFVGLRAKLYSYKILDGSEDKYCKGSQRMLQKGVLHSMTIESACFSRKEQHRKMNVIRSHFHEIYTEEIKKLPSLLTMANELLWPTEYTLWLIDAQT